MADEIDDVVSSDPLGGRPLRTNATNDEESLTRKKLKPVVAEGVAVEKKKSIFKKFKETFTGDDAHSVISYVFYDVMVPAAKEMVVDMGREGLERMFFGESRHRGRSSSIDRKPYTPYGRVSYHDEPVREISRRARSTHDFREIILPSRGEAEEVIERLSDAIAEFGLATVEDLYDLVGITGSFADVKYGWTTARGMSADRVREGFMLNLPSPQLID